MSRSSAMFAWASVGRFPQVQVQATSIRPTRYQQCAPSSRNRVRAALWNRSPSRSVSMRCSPRFSRSFTPSPSQSRLSIHTSTHNTHTHHPSSSAKLFRTLLRAVGVCAAYVVAVTGLHEHVHAICAIHGYVGIFLTQALAFPLLLSACMLAPERREREKEWAMGHLLFHWMSAFGIWKVTVTGIRNIPLHLDDPLPAPVPSLQLDNHASLSTVPSDSFVVVCNHVSFSDNIFLTLLPFPKRYLTKLSYSLIPVFGWSQRLANDIPIDLSSPAARAASVQACVSALHQNRSVVIYPEGTRSSNSSDRAPPLQPFKSGAFRIAVAGEARTLPVVISGSGQAMGRYLNAGNATVEVRVLPMVELPRAGGGGDVEELSNTVRAVMSNALKEMQDSANI